MHIGHHAAPCIVSHIYHARTVYCRFQHWDDIKGHLVLQDDEGKRTIDFINPYLRIQLASTFGLKQGGSCKKSAWIEDHIYAHTPEFFITRCYSANCVTILRHHALVFADKAWLVCNVQGQVPEQCLYTYASPGFSPDVLQGQL